MKTKTSYQNLFAPKSIAIVGASEKEGKVGTVIAENILTLGYAGEVFLVNPQYDILYQRTCYKNLSDIKNPVDLAIIAVPAKFVADVIKASANKVKNFVIVSAGFAETGDEGKAREKEIALLAEEHGLNILGPNCLGFIVPALKLNASFAAGMPEAGNIAFVSQSGALAVALMDMAHEKNLSFSSVISVGNKMQIDESVLLEYFLEDKNTKVIAMYLEGIKDGRKFIEVAQKVSQKKPIVVLKAGKSTKAQVAISSHTGALAGSDIIIDKAFEKAGILRAENLEDFFGLISFISKYDAPKSEKVAVVTNAGGAGVLSADAFEGKNIQLADFSDSQRKEMSAILPEESSTHNPIDVLGDAGEDRYENILNVLEKNKELSSIICILTPQEQTPVSKIAEKIAQFQKKSKKIVVASFVGGERIKEAVEFLKNSRVENFSYPERAVKIINDYFNWSKLSAGIKVSKESGKINSKRQEMVGQIVSHARLEGRGALYFDEASDVMELYGITSAPTVSILPRQSLQEEIVFPLVAKIDSDKVLHKSDKQALIIGIQNMLELDGAMKKLRKDFPNERIILQSMQEKGMELILGIKRDPIFGSVIVYGMGGIYTEIFKKVDFLLPPLDKKEIEKQLLEGQLGFLLSGARGQKPYDAKELVDILWGMVEFSRENTQIKECDINPLFIYNDGNGSCAVDIKIII